MRKFALLLAVLLFAASALADKESPQPNISRPAATSQDAGPATDYLSGLLTGDEIEQSASSQFQAAACCKICRKGKACGDSCIARWKTCRKGPGCACDGN